MDWKWFYVCLVLHLTQADGGDEETKVELDSSIADWVDEMRTSILESHSSLKEKIFEVEEDIKEIWTTTLNEVLTNASNSNQGLCPKGMQINMAAETKQIRCLSKLATEAMAKQIQVQLRCFSAFVKYAKKMTVLGKQMVDCSGNEKCNENLKAKASAIQSENNAVVEQNMNHLSELEESIDEGKIQCFEKSRSSSSKIKDACSSEKSLNRTKREFEGPRNGSTTSRPYTTTTSNYNNAWPDYTTSNYNHTENNYTWQDYTRNYNATTYRYDAATYRYDGNVGPNYGYRGATTERNFYYPSQRYPYQAYPYPSWNEYNPWQRQTPQCCPCNMARPVQRHPWNGGPNMPPWEHRGPWRPPQMDYYPEGSGDGEVPDSQVFSTFNETK